MKKFFLIVLLSGLFMLGSACGGATEKGDTTHGLSAEQMQTRMEDLAVNAVKYFLTGNYAMLLTIADPMDKKLVNQFSSIVETSERRGIKPQPLPDGISFKIIGIEDVDKDKANVKLAVNDGKGNIDNLIVKLVKRDGKWYYSQLKI